MGKMILDDLRKRLERLDEDADLMIDNNDRYQMVIVGGFSRCLSVVQRYSSTHPVWKIW